MTEREFESIGEAASVALAEAKEHNKNREGFDEKPYYDSSKLDNMSDMEMVMKRKNLLVDSQFKLMRY